MATILVVEADRSLRELLRVHLTNAGHDVLLAEDALAAGPLLLERTRGVDLAIVDAQLPYLGGVELVATMIADTSLPPIPIVLIATHEQRGAESLGVPCLYKPFRADQLISLVGQMLPSESSAALREAALKVANAG